jgi:hypothetical protein
MTSYAGIHKAYTGIHMYTHGIHRHMQAHTGIHRSVIERRPDYTGQRYGCISQVSL